MATEYVKRKDVIEKICNLCRIENDDCSYPRCTIINTVKNIPAADVVERKHGKLEETGMDEYWGLWYNCSLCGESIPGKRNFCPNCGADMRGEDDV